MNDESHEAKIARIDTNVTTLLALLPIVQQLDIDSAVNKREHKIAGWGLGVMLTPVVLWCCKKLGVPIF